MKSAVACTVSAAIANWVVGDTIGGLPPEAFALVKRAFLDTLAVTLLGARMAAPRIAAGVEFARRGSGPASVCGMGRRIDVLSAALINGTSSHAELFDDNNAPMIAHPSGALVSTLLPLAQSRHIGGRAVLEAYATGFEVGVKLGRMLNPKLYEKGWHATRVLGVVGATAASARLIQLDASHTGHALGIATSMAGGIRQNFGTMTMALHVGFTARDAVHAVLLAEAGFGADPTALEGKYGFFQVFGEQVPAMLTLGEPHELMASGIIFKPFASGAPTLAAVDAALELRRRLDGNVDAIEQITCYVHRWNAMTLRENEPQDALQAKVNLRFCVAAALLYGSLGYREFSESALADPRLRALMRRTAVTIANDLPDNSEFPAEVRIKTNEGLVLSHRSDVPPGGSTRPLTDANIIDKFRDCAANTLSPAAIEAVIEHVYSLDTLSDVSILCEATEGRPLSV